MLSLSIRYLQECLGSDKDTVKLNAARALAAIAMADKNRDAVKEEVVTIAYADIGQHVKPDKEPIPNAGA